jgi:two-component system chemotaxis response regulator CheB
METKSYKAIVMGSSSGGMGALKAILPALPANYGIPLIIVQHIGASSDSYWIEALNKLCMLEVKEADEKEKVMPGYVYIAPPNYHLLVEKDETLSLANDERVNYAKPSIDVLFETAADAYGRHLAGVVLTGSNNDGAAGLKKIKACGGLAIVQDPATAESSYMPAAAVEAVKPDHILPLEKIADLLRRLKYASLKI